MKSISIALQGCVFVSIALLSSPNIQGQNTCAVSGEGCITETPWFVLIHDKLNEVNSFDPKCCDTGWDFLCTEAYLHYIDYPDSWEVPVNDPRPECATDCEAVKTVLDEIPSCYLAWNVPCRQRYSELSNTCLAGCTDPFGCNYNPQATLQDNTCDYTCRCPCDLNNDGIVNVSDLHFLLANMDCQGDCPADLNEDGVVSFADLAIFNSHFGSPCF